MRRAPRAAVAAAALGLMGGGLLGAAVPAADAHEAAAPAPTINVYVAKNHTVAMTTRLRPGVHRFVVRSGGAAGFELIRPAAGYTKDEVARDVFRAFARNRMRALTRLERHLTFMGGINTAPGQAGSMWATLPAGTYWAVDTAPNSVRPGDILTVHVGGDRVAGGVGRASVVRAVHEADWAATPRAIPHRGRLTFRNDSTDNHFLDLAKLAPGKTVKDFARWIRQVKNGAQVPPPVDQSAEISTGVLSPGQKMTIPYDLPPGRYVMICWWPDAEHDGMPHAFMGMYRGIRLE